MKKKNQTEWINVSDKFPDKNGEYLCVIYSKPDKQRVENSKGRWGFYAYGGEYGYIEDGDGTHWLPLPELPKGVGHDERQKISVELKA